MKRKPIRLTQTSYAVLALFQALGEATSYDLKQLIERSIENFWQVPHTTAYDEPARLAEGGYLTVRQEEGGRRRKLYELTAKGRRALDDWRAESTSSLGELREPSLLKLFFGADPARLAAAQIPAHRAKLAEYEAIRDGMPGEVPDGPRLALEAGINHERSSIAFWERFAE
jgi:DNA-binding PadR family transcriptional regulator